MVGRVHMEGNGSFTDAGVQACSCLSVCVCGIPGNVCVAVTPTHLEACATIGLDSEAGDLTFILANKTRLLLI